MPFDRTISDLDKLHSSSSMRGAHGKNFNDMDLLAIIRRVDTNGDATIDLNEWTEFLRVKHMDTRPIGLHPMGLGLGPHGVPPHAFTN